MANKTFSIQVSDELYADLTELAHRQGKSLGAVVREAICQYLASGVVIVPVRGLLDSKTRVPGAAE